MKLTINMAPDTNSGSVPAHSVGAARRPAPAHPDSPPPVRPRMTGHPCHRASGQFLRRNLSWRAGPDKNRRSDGGQLEAPMPRCTLEPVKCMFPFRRSLRIGLKKTGALRAPGPESANDQPEYRDDRTYSTKQGQPVGRFRRRKHQEPLTEPAHQGNRRKDAGEPSCAEFVQTK